MTKSDGPGKIRSPLPLVPQTVDEPRADQAGSVAEAKRLTDAQIGASAAAANNAGQKAKAAVTGEVHGATRWHPSAGGTGRFPWHKAMFPIGKTSELAARGIGFIPGNELPNGHATVLSRLRDEHGLDLRLELGSHPYFHSNAFAAFLAENASVRRAWPKLMRQAIHEGLLTADALRASSGLVHTMPGIQNANHAPGASTSRTGYLGGQLFVKGWGVSKESSDSLVPGRADMPVPYFPSSRDVTTTHRIWGSGSWDTLALQFTNHLWMHMVTTELFGELAATVLPLRLMPQTAMRTETGEIVDTATAWQDPSAWQEGWHEMATDIMRGHLKGKWQASENDPAHKTALMWLADNRPAEMSYLFPVQRDTASLGSFLAPSSDLPPPETRLATALEQLQKSCKHYGAWSAFLFEMDHMTNPAGYAKDLARGNFADIDEPLCPIADRAWEGRSASMFKSLADLPPEALIEQVGQRLAVNPMFVEQTAQQILTADDWRQHGPALQAEAKRSFHEGFAAAIEHVILSHGDTPLVSGKQRMDLRRIWKTAFMAKLLPPELDEILARHLPHRLAKRRDGKG